jgi:hypothetical protein
LNKCRVSCSASESIVCELQVLFASDLLPMKKKGRDVRIRTLLQKK